MYWKRCLFALQNRGTQCFYVREISDRCGNKTFLALCWFRKYFNERYFTLHVLPYLRSSKFCHGHQSVLCFYLYHRGSWKLSFYAALSMPGRAFLYNFEESLIVYICFDDISYTNFELIFAYHHWNWKREVPPLINDSFHFFQTEISAFSTSTYTPAK